MPCNHKFIEDLNIQYAEWEVCTLFIGTFNPGWKVCTNNTALWFYGRPRNKFWCILPHVHGTPSLIPGNRANRIAFCRKNKIAVTDIIMSLNNAHENNPTHHSLICHFRDEELCQFEITPTNVPSILETHPSIKQICITRLTHDDCIDAWFAPTKNWVDANPQRQIQFRYLDSPAGHPIRGINGMNFCHYVANQWVLREYQIFR